MCCLDGVQGVIRRAPRAADLAWPSGLPPPRVWIYPNDGGLSTTPEPVLVDGSVTELMLFAREILGLSMPVFKICTLRGREIRRVDQLKNNMELAAVCHGEKFETRNSTLARAKGQPSIILPTCNFPHSEQPQVIEGTDASQALQLGPSADCDFENQVGCLLQVDAV